MRVDAPGGIIGEPSSIAPSTGTGRKSPCQWTMSASSEWLWMSIDTSMPCFMRSSGPGTWPL
jgi:hypothetical protein